MNQIELFEKKYNKGEMIIDSNDFIIYSGEEKEIKKNVIIKEYKPEFVNKMKDNISLFDIEMLNLKRKITLRQYNIIHVQWIFHQMNHHFLEIEELV